MRKGDREIEKNNTMILFLYRRQYDVYSKDVELANKMESSGMAG